MMVILVTCQNEKPVEQPKENKVEEKPIENDDENKV